ncbi:MAG TPA: peptidyl-prolyl cis-trans isomerase [Bacilli bacterium]
MRNVRILWTVIGLLLVCVMYLTFVNFNRDEQPERILAKIGEYHITYQQLHKRLEQKYGKELLNQILDNEAIAHEGNALGLTITEVEIAEELKRMQLGYDSEEQFYSSMNDQLGLTKEDIKKDIFYKLLLEKIAIHQIVITDERVEAYIDEHPEEFKSQTQIRLMQIVVGTPIEAEEVIKELLGGADFAALAVERSIDDMTAADGGDLGWVELDDPFVQEEIMQAANQLSPGEISTPVAIAEGYAVIKVTDREEPDPQDEVKLKEVVRKELALNQAVPLKELLSSIRNELGTVILDPKLK